MTLPAICHECDEDAYDVFDHEDGCGVARRIAQRQLDELEDKVGTPWETPKTEEWIQKYRDFLESDE